MKLLRNGLFIRKLLPNLILLLLNLLSKKETKKIIENPTKILLCNIAHLGDVVISTTVLPILKKKYPDAQIDFLTSSKSSIVVKNHPFVTKVHTFDHFVLHRHLGLCKAALHHMRSWKKVCGVIKKENYSLAIDLYSYFPNAIPLLKKAKVPIRIGYPTGGFGNLLTHQVHWDFPDVYIGYAHLHLLSALSIDTSKMNPLAHYSFSKKKEDHIVIHMGSSNEHKEWDIKHWILLIQQLSPFPIHLTGNGEREKKIISIVCQKTHAKDYSDLTWKAYVKKVQEAKLLITVDTVASHIAASHTPTIVLCKEPLTSKIWLPPTAHPLFFGKKGFEIDLVYQKALQLLE